MRPTTLLLACLTPAAVLADWMETTWTCDADLFVICGYIDKPYSHFHTDFGSYYVWAQDGCRSPAVPGMTELCVDWGNARAHFKFSHQDYKRCLRKNAAGQRFTDDSCPGGECWRDVWSEVACTW